jgi:hypothetical protein
MRIGEDMCRRGKREPQRHRGTEADPPSPGGFSPRPQPEGYGGLKGREQDGKDGKDKR